MKEKLLLFKIEKLTNILDGCKENTTHKQYIRKLIENDKVFERMKYHWFSPEQKYEDRCKEVVAAQQLIRKYKLKSEIDQMLLYEEIQDMLPDSVHRLMFIVTLENLGTEEQKNKWLKDAKNYRIIGTYAQTELGHGSSLTGLETTAIYIKKDDEFEINTPSPFSVKYWPGGLGRTATHCVLMVQLIIDGKRFGLHPFVVQLRSLTDHPFLSGITTGSIGPKYGWNSIDNGWAKFEQVRIP